MANLAPTMCLEYKSNSSQRRLTMASLSEYMARYDHEHTNRWNKVCHGIGIPLVIVSLILLVLLRWRIGLTLFVLGWIFLFGGHRIEGNKPAFFQGVIYFLVGPIWVAKEIKEAFLGRSKNSTAIR
jgi:uncharacterized membrane protein YGL010W